MITRQHHLAEMVVPLLAVKGLQLTQKEASAVIGTCFDLIGERLHQGGEVKIHGFGTFRPVQSKARMGFNPQKPSERIPIPAKVLAKFRAGKGLKTLLNPQA